MKLASLVWVCAAIVSVSLAGLAVAQVGTAKPVAVEPKELSGMLASQNQVRSRLSLAPLVWSEALTTKARDTAKTASEGACSMTAADKAAKAKGATVYWASASRRLGGADVEQVLTPAYVVARWREGQSSYNSKTATCKTQSPECTAYARMVSPKSRQLGCAKMICSSKAQLWVCHYGE